MNRRAKGRETGSPTGSADPPRGAPGDSRGSRGCAEDPRAAVATVAGLLLLCPVVALAACGGGDADRAGHEEPEAERREAGNGDDVVTVRQSGLELAGLTVAEPRPGRIDRTATLVGRLERDPALRAVVRSPASGRFRVGLGPGREVPGGDTMGWVSSPETYPDSLPLTAPVGGDVLELPEGPSGLVEAWAPLAVVASTDTLRLVVPVPPDLYDAVREGTLLRVPVSPEDPDRGLAARVTGFLEPDDESSRLRAVARVPASGSDLAPGMRVPVTTSLGDDVAGHWVPGEAVVYDRRQPGRTVAYLREGDEYRQVPVEVARRGEDSVFVSSGLASGDRVVADGAHQLLYADFSFRGIGAEAGEMEEGEEDEDGP